MLWLSKLSKVSFTQLSKILSISHFKAIVVIFFNNRTHLKKMKNLLAVACNITKSTPNAKEGVK